MATRRPAKRKVSTTKRRKPAVRRTPAKRTTINVRSNPARRSRVAKKGMLDNVLKDNLKPVAIASLGALAGDIAMGQANKFLPNAFTQGAASLITKTGIAFGLGALASKFGDKTMGLNVTNGGLTVVAHSIARGFFKKTVPQVQLGEYSDDVLSSDISLNAYDYIDDLQGLGFYNAAMVSGDSYSMDGLAVYDSEQMSGLNESYIERLDFSEIV